MKIYHGSLLIIHIFQFGFNHAQGLDTESIKPKWEKNEFLIYKINKETTLLQSLNTNEIFSSYEVSFDIQKSSVDDGYEIT